MIESRKDVTVQRYTSGGKEIVSISRNGGEHPNFFESTWFFSPEEAAAFAELVLKAANEHVQISLPLES